MSTEQQFGDEGSTEVKLRIFRSYSQAYFNLLKNWSQNASRFNKPFETYYIDAFAGCGYRTGKDGQQYDGSAKIVLDDLDNYPANGYYFIEKKKEHIQELENLKYKLSGDVQDKINIFQGDCNDILPRIMNNDFPKTGKYDNNRFLIFLDPFGLNVDFETLRELSRWYVDIVYLFPISSLCRNMPNDKKKLELEPRFINTISRCLGVENWVDDLYEQSPQLSLFGDDDKHRVSAEELEKYVTMRMGTIFKKQPFFNYKGWVSPDPFRLYFPNNNAHGFSLYLFVSNPSEKAVYRAKEIWKTAIKNYEKTYRATTRG